MLIRLISEVADRIKCGWARIEGNVVFEHPKLGKIIHVAVCKDDGTPLWDQFLHAEPIGAVTVPFNSKGQFGVIRLERPTVKHAELYTYPDLDLSTLGVVSVEFPRGWPKKGERGAQTAKREGEEEMGSPITNVVEIGEITPNTTFHPHRIPVYLAEVDEDFKSDIPPDVNEKILKVEWLEPHKISDLIKDGHLHCGMSLASYALALNYISRNSWVT